MRGRLPGPRSVGACGMACPDVWTARKIRIRRSGLTWPAALVRVLALGLVSTFWAGTGMSVLSQDLVGGIRGYVSLPHELEGVETGRAYLMPPDWALVWRGEVQRRLDTYSQTAKRAIQRDPALFQRISQAAYRESTAYVMAQMQAATGDDFEAWVKDVSVDGRFEYDGIPVGEYSVFVVLGDEQRNAMWIGTIIVTGGRPTLVEIENRIQ